MERNGDEGKDPDRYDHRSDVIISRAIDDVEQTPAGLLARQRRAVLLVEPESFTDSLQVIWQAATELAGGELWQILEPKAVRQDAWIEAARQADFSIAGEFFSPMQLARSNKYGTTCAFSHRRPVIVNLDGLTTNADSHAWTYFAPELRKATFVLGVGFVSSLPKLRTLVELIHPLDQCVVLDSESLRLG